MATVASFHRIGSCRQQLVIEKRPGFLQIRREDLVEGVANPLEPLVPLPQLFQLAQRCLGPATPVKQRVHVPHDLVSFAQLRKLRGDREEPFAFTRLQAAIDEQQAILK